MKVTHLQLYKGIHVPGMKMLGATVTTISPTHQPNLSMQMLPNGNILCKDSGTGISFVISSVSYMVAVVDVTGLTDKIDKTAPKTPKAQKAIDA